MSDSVFFLTSDVFIPFLNYGDDRMSIVRDFSIVGLYIKKVIGGGVAPRSKDPTPRQKSRVSSIVRLSSGDRRTAQTQASKKGASGLSRWRYLGPACTLHSPNKGNMLGSHLSGSQGSGVTVEVQPEVVDRRLKCSSQIKIASHCFVHAELAPLHHIWCESKT